MSTVTEKTDCFAVECKDICIPPVTFPWQCGPKKCGRVRTVNVLTTEEQERQVCEYKWDVRTICPHCREALRASGCDQGLGEQVISERVISGSVSAAAPAPGAATASRKRETSVRFPLLSR